MRFDLHVHTTISSCSRLTIEEIVSHGRARGLDGVCITDHDTMDVRNFLAEGFQPSGICVIFGLEYTTPEGDFLIFGPFEVIPSGFSGQELLRYVEQADGVAVAAHPCRGGRSTDENLLKKGHCNLVEGMNGRNSIRENAKAALLSELYGVGQVGGSDAHCLEELGQVTTCLHDIIHDRTDFIQALKKGSFTLERAQTHSESFTAPERTTEFIHSKPPVLPSADRLSPTARPARQA
jgi:predicted metal-dependent phosphoesterase TrpH